MGSERKAMNREKGKSSFIWKVSRSLETHEVGGPGDAAEESWEREDFTGSSMEGQGRVRTEISCTQR